LTKKAVIFDFGGVISKTMFETHHLTEMALGLEIGTLKWRGPFDKKNDHLWASMQLGDISERDYWFIRSQEVAKLIDANWSQMSDFVKAARGADPNSIIRPEFLNTLTFLKSKEVRLAILSNELDLFYGAEFRQKLKFLDEFDVICDATYTDILKPDPRAYHDCLNKLNLEVEDCIFVDDQRKNINGAENVGLSCIQFDVLDPSLSYKKVVESIQTF